MLIISQHSHVDKLRLGSIADGRYHHSGAHKTHSRQTFTLQNTHKKKKQVNALKQPAV